MITAIKLSYLCYFKVDTKWLPDLLKWLTSYNSYFTCLLLSISTVQLLTYICKWKHHQKYVIKPQLMALQRLAV